VKTYPSAGNFLLANFGPSGPALFHKLEKQGILLRERSKDIGPGLCASPLERNTEIAAVAEDNSKTNGLLRPEVWSYERTHHATHSNDSSQDKRDGYPLEAESDGRGKAHIATGIRFFDHMLRAGCSTRGRLIWTWTRAAILDVDQHHTVEDVGITLGEAVQKALGSKRGILRAGLLLDAHGRNTRCCRRGILAEGLTAS